MRPIIFIASALALLLVAFNPGSRAAESPATTLAPQDELTERVKKLEERVDKLESEKAALELSVAAHQKLLKDTFSWLASLPKAADALSDGMDQARKLGFEAAGPNPKAKAEVLESLKGFARALNAGNPASTSKGDAKD